LELAGATGLVEVRPHDGEARVPPDLRLVLRVEHGLLDFRRGVDLVLRELIARHETEGVEASCDLGAADVPVVPVRRPEPGAL
jgi:hypothetical protein